MARRVMTGIVFVLVLFALVRGVPAQQPGAPGQPGANPAGRGAQAPRESRVVRLDPAFDAIVPPGALIERVAGGFGFAEGPVWTSQGSLLFSDIPGNTIVRLMPNGESTPFRRPIYYGTGFRQGFHIGSNGLTLDKEGRVIIAEHGNRRVTRLEVTGEVTVLADKYDGKRLNSPNDVVVKSDEAVYFTDPPYGLPRQNDDPAKEIPFSGIYRVKDGKVDLVSKDVPWPNGLGFSPDEKYLIVANSDPMRRVWMRFELKPDGTLGPGVHVLYGAGRRTGWDSRRIEAGRRRQPVRHRARRRLDHFAGGKSARPDRAARGPGQRGLGRRRQDVVHDGEELGLPDSAEHEREAALLSLGASMTLATASYHGI